MIEPMIACPSCRVEIKLTESLAAPLLEATRAEYESKLHSQEALLREREAALREEKAAIAKARAALDEEVEAKLKAAKAQIAADEARKARTALGEDLEARGKEIAELKTLMAEREAKLAEAQKAQAELMRKERALEDEKRELDLTIEKRVGESLVEVRNKTRLEVEQDLKLKVSEKEEQIASMQRQIEELKRKAEQGSQQLQGEVSELDLQFSLAARFPTDLVEPVAKGQLGADLLQRVTTSTGQSCGAIIWECKRTKNWSNDWLPKLRADQRSAHADIPVLVTLARPKEIESFGLIDGVWIADPLYALPLAIVLRQSLIELANARQAREGQQTKMELIYHYLTGPKFRHRVEAIVERIADMQADLDRERKAMTRLWSKREMQIQGVIEATVGMHGDLQGIAGRALQEIEGLELPLLEEDRSDEMVG